MANPGFGSGSGSAPPDASYRCIVVETFSAEPGLELPAKFKITIASDIITHLKHIDSIQVFSEGQKHDCGVRTVRLAGTVTQYKGGSRALRYMVPLVVGKTKIGAHIRLLDAAADKTLYETDVDGKVTMGPFGGDSMGASNGLAKEVAKRIQRQFLRIQR